MRVIRMDESPRNAVLIQQLARAHGGLARRAAAADSLAPASVLDLGAAVLFHGAVERELLFPVSPFLASEVQTEDAARHAQLADDLALLESLIDTDPDSPDVGILASALLARLKAHIARDDRVFYHTYHVASP
jgi:hypothetical protein